MKATFHTLGIALALGLAGCSQNAPTAPNFGNTVRGTMSQSSATGASPAITSSSSGSSGRVSTSSAGSVKGAGGEMPAFYDGQLFTINSVEVSDVAADHVGANPSHNEIFVTNDLDEEQDFIPVLDAIQGDGFNPLWEQILIVFNPGVAPHQFKSDDEVHGAASGARPEITLVDTGEVYRCSVVGAK